MHASIWIHNLHLVKSVVQKEKGRKEKDNDPPINTCCRPQGRHAALLVKANH